MAHSRTLLSLGAVSTLAFLLAAPGALAATPVGGQVTDEQGKALAGAEVVLQPVVSTYRQALSDLEGVFHPEPVDRAESGKDGGFRLSAPHDGLWEVVVTATGRVPTQIDAGPLFGTEELAPLALEEDDGLTVRVVDGAGRPVGGALVAARRAGLKGTSARRWRRQVGETLRRRALTGEDGVAVLPRRGDEILAVSAAAPGFAPAVAETVEEAALTLGLEPGRPVTVEVRGPDGSPHAGAVLLADGLPLGSSDEAGRLPVHAPSDRLLAGAVLGESALQGRLTLAPPEEGKVVEGGDGDDGAPPPPVVVRLTRPVTVSGRVLAGSPDGQAAPLAGAWVWEPGRRAAAVRSDDRGGFSLTRPAPEEDERGVVAAAADGHLPAQHWMYPPQVAGDEPVTLLLSPAAAVAGRVVDADGEAVTGAVVTASPLDPRLGMSTYGAETVARSRADGAFHLAILTPDTPHRLSVRHAGYAPASVEVGGVDPGAARSDVEIVLRPGITAFGSVLDLEGEAVPGAEAVLRTLPEGGDMLARFGSPQYLGDSGESATADRAGVFEIHDLAPGRYDLAVSAAGFAPLLVPGVELPRGQAEVDLGSVVLEPGVSLRGTVVDAAGRPVEGAQVQVSHDRGVASFFRRDGDDGKDAVTTGADGVFRVDDLARDRRVQVMVRHEGHAERMVQGIRVPPEEPLVITLDAASRLSGVVVDGDGEAIENARVTSRSLGDQGFGFAGFAHATTDETGSFTLEDVSPGEVTVWVSARGFVEAERTGLQIGVGEVRDDLRFTLEPGATVEGRVSDEGGRPLADARVQVVGGERRQFSGGASTVSDAEGRYRLEGVPLGERSVAADHDEHLRQVLDLEVTRGENRLDFRLPAGTHVAGRVLDAGGAPVAGARVMLGKPGTLSFNVSLAVASSEDGAYRISGVGPGRYQVTATKEGYAAATLDEPIEVAGAPLEGVDLRLTTGASIVGRLLGVELQDLAGATVGAGSQGPSVNRLPVMGSVDYEGNFRIEGVSPGDWLVFAAVGGGLSTTREPVTVEPGDEEVFVELDLGSGFTLSGTVTLGGEPMSGAAVVVAASGQLRGGFASTDHRGRFQVNGLEAGEYEVTVTSLRGGAPAHEEKIEIAGDRKLTIDVPAAEVAGVITDAVTGAALEGAEVRLEATERQGRAGGGFWARRSDADGRYRLPDVPAGDYRLVAELAGYAPGEAAVRVEGAAAVSGVDLRLQPTRGLDLVVRSTLGPPPAWVQVAAFDPAVAAATPGTPGSELGGAPAAGGDQGGTTPAAVPRAVFNARLQTGEGGRLRLDRLPAGRWRLVVGAAGLANTTLEVTAPGPSVPVTLGPEAVLQVRVPELEAGRGKVRLTAADGRPHLGLGWNGEPVASWGLVFGRTQVDGLPGGTWTVTVTAADGSTWSGRVAVPAGGTAEAVLDGPPR